MLNDKNPIKTFHPRMTFQTEQAADDYNFDKI